MVAGHHAVARPGKQGEQLRSWYAGDESGAEPLLVPMEVTDSNSFVWCMCGGKILVLASWCCCRFAPRLRFKGYSCFAEAEVEAQAVVNLLAVCRLEKTRKELYPDLQAEQEVRGEELKEGDAEGGPGGGFGDGRGQAGEAEAVLEPSSRAGGEGVGSGRGRHGRGVWRRQGSCARTFKQSRRRGGGVRGRGM